MAFGAPAFGSSPFSGFSSAASPLSYISEPPDLSEIKDPTVVVVLKNLLKKDENTKARALEDLLSKLKASDNVDDAVIDVWVGLLFPRKPRGRRAELNDIDNNCAIHRSDYILGFR